MKKSILIIAIMVFVLLSSCHKDKPDLKEKKCYFENNEMIVIDENGNKTNYGLLDENSKLDEFYNVYISINKDYKGSKDDFYKEYNVEQEDPIITEAKIECDDNGIWTLYSKDGQETSYGLLTRDNMNVIYDSYKEIKGYEKDVEAFFDEFVIKEEDNLNFTYRLDSNSYYTITGYQGTEENITLPTYYKGIRVKGISQNAFKSKNVISITIPFSYELVEKKGFYFATKLETVIFDNDNCIIEEEGFSYCKALKAITLPKQITSLAPSTFKECTNLKTVNGMDNIKEIGKGAFTNCASIESILLPESLETIGDEAFSGCISLDNVTIPNKVLKLDTQTFYDCTGLKTLDLGDNLTFIGSYCFCNCTSLQNVIFPTSLVTLDGGAFDSCTGLTEVIFPDSLRSVGTGIFMNCTNLVKVVVNEGLEELAASSFTKCTSLKDITISSTITFMSHTCFGSCTALEKIVLPEGLRAIYDGNFNGCKNLKEVNIPSTVKSIGRSSFANCKALKSISIPDGCVDINQGTLSGCTSLEYLRVPFIGVSETEEADLSWVFGTIPSSLKTVEFGSKVHKLTDSSIPANSIENLILNLELESISDNAFKTLSATCNILLRSANDTNNLASLNALSTRTLYLYKENGTTGTWYIDENGNIVVNK